MKIPTVLVKLLFFNQLVKPFEKQSGQSGVVFVVSTVNIANYRIRDRSLHTVLMKKRCNPELQEQNLGPCTVAFS